MTILEQVAKTYNRFCPMSASDFFALCLAHRLDDKDAATHYAALVSQVGQGSLLVAYTRAKKHQGGGESLSKRFHLELENISGGSVDAPGNLLSLRIERRTIAAAVFIGMRLDFTNSRELSSNPEKAEASTLGFLDWLIQNVQCESAALELETEFEIRRGALNACAQKLLRGHGVSLWEVSKRDLLPRFGLPPLKSRKELREIVQSIWPVLDPHKAGILDATALGLYVQTERLFIN